MFSNKTHHSSSEKDESENRKPAAVNDTSTKTESGDNSQVMDQAACTTVKRVSPLHSVVPQLTKGPSMFSNEYSNKYNDAPKEITLIKKSLNSTVLGKRSSMKKGNKVKIKISAVKPNLPYLKRGVKVFKKSTRKCSSFTNSRKREREACYSPSPLIENTLTLTPPSLNFEDVHSNYNLRHFDYLKEFDSVLNRDLFSPVSNSYRSSDSTKSVFSLAPKMSSPLKPFMLKRRIYSCELLSLKDSAVSSTETEKNGQETEAKTESDNEESYASAEETRTSVGKDSAVGRRDKGTDLASDKEAVQSPSILFENEPLRIKCIDEATKHLKELIIYSNEFLSSIKEKNIKTSEKEVFKSLIQQCTDYEGKNMRVIVDSKSFLNSLLNNSKSKENNKPNILSKIPKIISQKCPNNVMKNVNKVPNISCLNKNYGGTSNMNSSNKSEKSIQQIHKPSIAKVNENKYSAAEQSLFSRANVPNPTKKSPKDVHINRNEENSRKSRIAQKRVNVEEIISSKFRQYFHFYAKFRSRLKSGIAISKSNSNFWLKTCGIIYDDDSQKLADDCFEDVAKTKCILNISDYVQYLTAYAKNARLIVMDVVEQMMSIDIHSLRKLSRGLETNRSTYTVKRING